MLSGWQQNSKNDILKKVKGIVHERYKNTRAPGFRSCYGVRIQAEQKRLDFEKEYNLNTKPLEIDLLVIKKESSVQLTNEIGKFFKGHNIVEYKSPEDHPDIDTFYKTGAYASLYKS